MTVHSLSPESKKNQAIIIAIVLSPSSKKRYTQYFRRKFIGIISDFELNYSNKTTTRKNHYVNVWDNTLNLILFATALSRSTHMLPGWRDYVKSSVCWSRWGCQCRCDIGSSSTICYSFCKAVVVSRPGDHQTTFLVEYGFMLSAMTVFLVSAHVPFRLYLYFYWILSPTFGDKINKVMSIPCLSWQAVSQAIEKYKQVYNCNYPSDTHLINFLSCKEYLMDNLASVSKLEFVAFEQESPRPPWASRSKQFAEVTSRQNQ